MFVTGLTVVIHAWQMLANKFLTYPVPHYCRRPGNKIKKVIFEKNETRTDFVQSPVAVMK